MTPQGKHTEDIEKFRSIMSMSQADAIVSGAAVELVCKEYREVQS